MLKILSKSSSSCASNFKNVKRSLFVSKYRFTSVDLDYSCFEPTKSSDEARSPVIILHGLLGSKGNWKSLAKRIANNHSTSVYTLDARNHGDSPHINQLDYYSMADDVISFMQKKNILSSHVIGHSMGGRTAMMVALQHPQAVDKLVVVDVSPISMAVSSSVIPKYLSVMTNLIQILPHGSSLTEARHFADNHLTQTVPDLNIRQFLLINLTKEERKFIWKANIPAIQAAYSSGIAKFEIPLGSHFNKPTLFISGSKSDYLSEAEHSAIQELFPQSTFHTISDAGHWVHSEKPNEFLAAVQGFFNN